MKVFPKIEEERAEAPRRGDLDPGSAVRTAWAQMPALPPPARSPHLGESVFLICKVGIVVLISQVRYEDKNSV